MLSFYTTKRKECNIIIILSIVSILFIMLGHMYRDMIQLGLQKKVIDVPSTIIDLWSVSHFMLFGIFGYLIPNKHCTFFTMGVVWELIEDFLSSDENTQLVKCDKKKLWCNGLQDDHWYAKWDDVIVNLLGYTIGSSLKY